MNFIIEPGLQLEMIDPGHAGALFTAIDHNRDHLAGFLPWVSKMLSVEDVSRYIAYCTLLHEQGTELSFVIRLEDRIVGRIGLHYIDTRNKSAAIGYWLTREYVGRGIILSACKQLISHGFSVLGLHRIEIKAATGNLRSQAIPRKLGFSQEGILRQAELVNGVFLDLVLFSLLQAEWTSEVS